MRRAIAFAVATLAALALPETAHAETPPAGAPAATAEPAAKPAEPAATDAKPAPAPVAQAKPAAPPAPTLVAKVDLTTQSMVVLINGKTTYNWKVSSGADGYATPIGSFKPDWMAKMWYSRQYDNAPMPHAVFFKNGAAIHATTSLGRLGTAASHGCVRLSPTNAETFYKLVSRHSLEHTRIIVSGRAPGQDDRIARRDRSRQQPAWTYSAPQTHTAQTRTVQTHAQRQAPQRQAQVKVASNRGMVYPGDGWYSRPAGAMPANHTPYWLGN